MTSNLTFFYGWVCVKKMTKKSQPCVPNEAGHKLMTKCTDKINLYIFHPSYKSYNFTSTNDLQRLMWNMQQTNQNKGTKDVGYWYYWVKSSSSGSSMTSKKCQTLRAKYLAKGWGQRPWIGSLSWNTFYLSWFEGGKASILVCPVGWEGGKLEMLDHLTFNLSF